MSRDVFDIYIAAKLELKAYESKIDALFLSNGFAALRFERCIRTKGRDHNHEHNVPIPDNDIECAITVFQNTARYYRLDFMELQVCGPCHRLSSR